MPRLTGNIVFLWKRGLLRKKKHFLEILENLEILEKPPTVEKNIAPSCSLEKEKDSPIMFARDSREYGDFRKSRDSSNAKTPFVMTACSVSEISKVCVFVWLSFLLGGWEKEQEE